MSALRADVWADLIAWAVTTAPLFFVHHKLLKRHVTRITLAQTKVLQALKMPPLRRQDGSGT